MNIGEEIDTRTVTPVRTKTPAEKPGIPQRATPARPAKPVENPDKAPVKTPSK